MKHAGARVGLFDTFDDYIAAVECKASRTSQLRPVQLFLAFSGRVYQRVATTVLYVAAAVISSRTHLLGLCIAQTKFPALKAGRILPLSSRILNGDLLLPSLSDLTFNGDLIKRGNRSSMMRERSKRPRFICGPGRRVYRNFLKQLSR